MTLAGFFASAYGGSTLSEPLGEVLVGWGMPVGIAGTVAFIAVTAFISYLSLVLGELVPTGQHLGQRLRQRRPAVCGGEEAGEGHADLHGGEETVRVGAQLPYSVAPLPG